jgi:hypothetical protein
MTDIDMCGYLDQADRSSLKNLGFRHQTGDHFAYQFSDGQIWLLEFPESEVDGGTMKVRLDQDETLDVISVEFLLVDRMAQATDGTRVTFDEAVRLWVAVIEKADWKVVEQEIARRDAEGSIYHLRETYERVMAKARFLLSK